MRPGSHSSTLSVHIPASVGESDTYFPFRSELGGFPLAWEPGKESPQGTKKAGSGSERACAQIPALTLADCVTLGKSLSP